MEKSAKIFVAGHRGMVGSAIHRKLAAAGYENLVIRTRAVLIMVIRVVGMHSSAPG